MTKQELLTASQAADALSATSQTIRNWIGSGRLPAVRIGNRFLVPRAEVDRLRGELPAVAVGEGVWESAEDAPIVPLPRAAAVAGGSEPAVTDGLLGA
jgi:excisionase family DNA binding protein